MAILFVFLIFAFLLREGLPAFTEVPLDNLFSSRWYPTENYFGILPLIFGSLVVTIGAAHHRHADRPVDGDLHRRDRAALAA